MKIDKMPPETRDAKCRAILSTKSLITLIAQDLLPEYQGYSRKEIETFIEQGLDTKDRIIGLNNEDGITQKDIVFFMKNPTNDEKIGLIINLEMQVKADSSYPLMQRAIHNIARMITSQKKVVFEHDDYGKIAKVYSIWILPIPGKRKEDSIAYYSMQEQLIEGNGKEEEHTYDLCGIYLLRLGDNSNRKVLQVLNLIFKTMMEREEKIRILEEVFDVHLSEEAKKEVNDNMMLGEWFREDGFKAGIEEGIISSIKGLMNSMSVSLEEAMNLLQISEEMKEKCRALLA